MKITGVEPVHLSLPFDHGAPSPKEGLGAGGKLDIIMVRVDTDAGITGWGEAFGHSSTPVTIAALRTVVAPLATGRDPSDIAAVMNDLWFRTRSMSRSGPVAFALSGLDIALWDIRGKVEGVPICRLLAGTGTPAARVPAYASLLRIGPEHVGNVAAQALACGYRSIKLHEHTVEAVAAARAAVGRDIPLMLDTNCHWASVEGAVAAMRALQPYDLAWIEEPLYPPDDFEGMARLRRERLMPIAGGENLGNVLDIRRVVEAQALDVVQPSIAKIGGVSAVVQAITEARKRNARVVLHSPFSGPALVAAVHVIAAGGPDLLCEHRYGELAARPLGDATEAQDGYLRVPDGPGLGFAVDPEVMARYRVA